MPVEVTGPDNQTYHFPDGTDKAAAVAYFKKKGIVAPGTTTIGPPPTGMKGVRASVNTGIGKVAEKTRENLPVIGATVGGLIGAGAGPLGAVGGAALGGGAGRAFQQLEDFSEGKRQPSSGAAAADIGIEAGKQGLFEAGGLGMAKLAAKILPISRGARLSYAGGLTRGEKEVQALAPEFDKTLTAAGSRAPNTVGEFATAIQGTNTRLEQEFDQALFPIAQAKVTPHQVATSIRQRITPNMAKTAEGREQALYLQRRAREFDRVKRGKEWTIADLNLERTKVSNRLNAYFKAGPSAARSKTLQDAEVMADLGARDALNDMLYSAADTSAGKPSGYFKALKQKQSVLTDLSNDIKAHRQKLLEASAQKKGAPMSEKAHIYGYAHPTSGHFGSAGTTVTPSRFLDPAKQADKMVRRGFPGTAGKAVNAARTAVGKAFSSADVNALPIRVLFADEPELDTTPPPKKSPGQQKRDLNAIVNHTNPNLPVGP